MGFIAGLGALSLWLGLYWRFAALDTAWRAAAKRLGLNHEGRGVFRSPRLSGTIGECRVLVEIGDAGSGRHLEHVVTRVIVGAPGIPLGFYASPQTVWGRMTQRFWKRPVAVGDGSFERRVRVDGDPTYALAVLNPGVRDRLLQLASLQGQVQQGELELTVRGRVRRADRLVSLVEFLVGLGRSLSVPEPDWPAALCARAIEDPSREVRKRSLEALVSRYPDSPETEVAIRDRLADFAPEVRLLAARHAGEDGLPVVSEVFHDPELTPDVRSDALRAWADLSPRRTGDLRRALAAALLAEGNVLFVTGASIIAQREDRALRPQLVAAYETGSPSVQAASLAALAIVGDHRDVEVAIEGLDSRDADVRAAAAKVLGRWGDRETVPALLPLTKGIGQPTQVKDEARAAIAAIQARTGGDRGQLALIESELEAGRLSVATTGAVSEPPDDAD